MSGRLSVLAVFVIVSLILTSVATAQIEYTSGIIAFYKGIITHGFYDPQDAKVACKPDNSLCVALVYEDSALFGEGVRILRSTGGNPTLAPAFAGKHFQNLQFSCGGAFGFIDTLLAGCSVVSAPADFTTDYISQPYLGDEYSHPFDIIYNEQNDVFYMLVTDHKTETFLYQYDGVNTPTEIDLSIMDAPDAEHTTKLGCCFRNQSTFYASEGVLNIGVAQCRTGVGYVDIDANTFQALTSSPATGGAWTPLSWASTPVGYGKLRGTDEEYYIQSRVTCNAVTTSYIHNELGYGGSWSGLDYFSDGYLYYTADSNATYRVSNDGASYGSAELIHAWQNNETINRSKSTSSDSNRVYLWERGVVAPLGIYAYNRRIYPFKIRAEGLNVVTGVSEFLDVTTQVVCLAENYTSTVSGVNQVITTPCLEDNYVTITVADWIPSTISITDVDVLTETGYTYIGAPANKLGWVSEYNFTMKFVDSFYGTPISGAQITVEGSTEVTDANGEVTYQLSPYGLTTFLMTSLADTYSLWLNGTLKTYDYTFQKTGYQTDYGTFRLVDTSTPDSASDFSTYVTFQADPIFARVIVDVYTSDGVHYDGDSVVVRMGGAQNGTFFDLDGVYIERNYASDFPATFVLIDERDSWTAKVNLTQDGYFVTDNISIVNSTFNYQYTFTLPNASTEQECSSDLGCAEDFCKGTLWYNDGECTGGICVYDIESCLLCDDEAGCYEATTAETCPTGLDYECIENNVCVDTKHLRSYKCSSSNMCVWELVECDYACEEDVCIPSAPVVECDQSTVAGMLSCLQAGMMSFIGSTYDPLMTIGIALGLVIIITALLALGFKAVTEVIR